jgi:hypothetical protein
MIITCPSCNAQYSLPDDAMAQKVAASNAQSCAHTWQQAPAGQDNIEFIQEQISENFTFLIQHLKPQPAERHRASKSEAVPVVKQAGMGSVMNGNRDCVDTAAGDSELPGGDT